MGRRIYNGPKTFKNQLGHYVKKHNGKLTSAQPHDLREHYRTRKHHYGGRDII